MRPELIPRAHEHCYSVTPYAGCWLRPSIDKTKENLNKGGTLGTSSLQITTLTDADSGRAKARGRGTANDEKVTTASGKTDASHGQREREVQARHHVTATPDGGIVHVHGESQMHARDTAGVRETAGSSGHIDGGDGGVEEVTEAEYMRGVKRKRDPG